MIPSAPGAVAPSAAAPVPSAPPVSPAHAPAWAPFRAPRPRTLPFPGGARLPVPRPGKATAA